MNSELIRLSVSVDVRSSSSAAHARTLQAAASCQVTPTCSGGKTVATAHTRSRLCIPVSWSTICSPGKSKPKQTLPPLRV
eukprot:scaffold7963_cov116-Isochrysis_galbana.AAC.16